MKIERKEKVTGVRADAIIPGTPVYRVGDPNTLYMLATFHTGTTRSLVNLSTGDYYHVDVQERLIIARASVKVDD